MLRIETPVSQRNFQGVLTGFTMQLAMRAIIVTVIKLQAAVLSFFGACGAMTWQRLIVSHSYGTISSYQSLDFQVLGPTMTIGPVV